MLEATIPWQTYTAKKEMALSSQDGKIDEYQPESLHLLSGLSLLVWSGDVIIVSFLLDVKICLCSNEVTLPGNSGSRPCMSLQNLKSSYS